VGTVAGGIDTFIRGVIRYAPEDIEFTVIGATTDPDERAVGKWTQCNLGRKTYSYLPIIRLGEPGRVPVIPVSLRYTLALIVTQKNIKGEIVELHEIEPAVGLLFDQRPKNVVIHTNMNAIRDRSSSVRWRHFPWLYFLLERLLMRQIDSVFSVRSDAVEDYKSRYPQFAERFRFTPTWVDSDVFSPPSGDERKHAKTALRRSFGLPAESPVFISVGRLSREKNPELLLKAFVRVHKRIEAARLVYIGDGNLSGRLKELVRKYNMETHVVLAGTRSAEEVAAYMRGADIFVLSSEFEGMPMSVLEALGCGLPVVTTDVGEVRRVVFPGENGEIVSAADEIHLADAMLNCFSSASRYRGHPCTTAVKEFMPEKVLKPIYENYRRLAGVASQLP
jgi:glycosyltransferase involved in cell wall biosynthesis